MPLNALLISLERDTQLSDAQHFVERMQALDALELHLPADAVPADESARLRMRRADALRQTLADADLRLFADLVRRVQANDRAAVSAVLRHTAARAATADDDLLGYDALDILVSGVLDVGRIPAAPQPLDADMVYYQPTPARVALRLVDALAPAPNDHFYDLGSGVGHIPILVHLLTGIRSTGVEIEPAYVRHAAASATMLELSAVTFVHADARHADYSDGTIFYLYTPFQGEMLRQVLARLQAHAQRHPIRICTYGVCTAHVARERWLHTKFHIGDHDSSLAVFHSQ